VEGRVADRSPGRGAAQSRITSAQPSLGSRLTPAAGFAAAFAAIALSLVVALAGGVDLAFPSAEGRIAIEVAASIIPAVVAYIFYGRARRSGAWSDVAMAVTMGTLTLTNFGFAVVPLLTDSTSETFVRWAPWFGRLLTAIGFGLAAFAPDRRVADPRRELVRLSIAGAAVLALVSVGVSILESDLPGVAAVGTDPGDSPTVAAIELLAMGAYLMTAWGFVRRADRTHERLMAWMAVSMALGAAARFIFALDPTLVAEQVHVGDLLLLASQLALLVGAFREIESYQRRMAESAVFQERRRLARDLHDGLAQELSYITAQSRRLAGNAQERRRTSDRLVSAAERALEESRMAIAALTRPVDEPLGRALVDTARSVGDRADVVVETDVDPLVDVAPAVREAMLRIVAEAIRNAARHGGAKTVWLSVRRERGLVLKLRDDGAGFALDAPRRPDALGLPGMVERAEALGATLRVESQPGSGTTVEFFLP
jgi:signal transduction histidine kinase